MALFMIASNNVHVGVCKFRHKQENGNQGRQGMTVAEMVAYGLPSTSNNSRQSSNTYQQQLRSMVMQQDQRNAEAIDR